jgi:hypothetical protein
MDRRAGALALLGAIIGAAGLARAEDVPGPDERVLVVSYFEKDVLENEIVPAIERNRLQHELPIYVGTFGTNVDSARLLHDRFGKHGRYAPIVSLVVGSEELWTGRQVRLPKAGSTGPTPSQPTGRYAGAMSRTSPAMSAPSRAGARTRGRSSRTSGAMAAPTRGGQG